MNRHFGGGTFDSDFDGPRLSRQFDLVWGLMRDGDWRTLAEIESATGAPQASVSARLRDFRKERFGLHTVEGRRRGNASRGLWEYRLTPNRSKGDGAQDMPCET